jgi:Xaa-Pro dipeptidase
LHNEQREKTQILLQQRGIHHALFAKPDTVRWLTGFTPPVELGPNPFASGNTLVWYDSGQFTLIVVDSQAELAAPFKEEPDGRVVTYLGYTVEHPIASAQFLLEAFAKTVASQPDHKIGIESEYVSEMIASRLRAPGNDIVSIDGWLEPLRMIKTEEELAKLRRNFALTDLGHAAARKAVAVGQREIDVWNALFASIQEAAGRRVPVGNDCVVGRRQQNIGGWPGDYELYPHDSLIVDLSVVQDGYWSDSCATYYAGERTAQQEKIHHIVQNALDYAISLIRPGVVAKEVDQKVRQFIADTGYPVYPHHTGHGVGVSGHEAPRIVPYSNEILQEGMVIMLEPGIYLPGETGVRLEDGMLIVKDGVELLTHHDKSGVAKIIE